MLSKGRPPVKTAAPPVEAKKAEPSELSEDKVDFMMAQPVTKKTRAKAKKHDIDNFDF